jgi:hypothetical protein
MRTVLVVLGLLVSLAACSDDDGGGGGGGPDDDSSLAQALTLVPSDARSMTFTDVAATTERLGVDDVTADSSEDEVARYVRTMSDAGAGTPLDLYLGAMLDGDAAFTALDVQWAVSGEVGDVYRLDDEVDLDAIGDDLVDAGYEEASDDPATYTLELDAVDETGLVGDRYPFLPGVIVLDPDDHLLVRAPDAGEASLVGDGESAADAGTFDDLLDGLDDVEVVSAVAPDDGYCFGALRSPATRDEVAERSGVADLGRPELVAGVVMGDGDEARTSVRLEFDDPDAAEDDAAAREDYLADGTSLQTQQPVSDLVSDVDVSVSGAVETIDLTLKGGLRTLQMMMQAADLAAACS